MQFLNQSDYNSFTQHFVGNQPVVMQHSRVSSLINHRLQGLDEASRKVLATPQVTGTPGNEQILWGTDAFRSTPRRLSDLQGEERARYDKILADTMSRLGNAAKAADDETRDILNEAVTHHAPESVYCADDRVVITEWGMHPKNVNEFSRMPLGVGIADDPVYPPKDVNRGGNSGDNPVQDPLVDPPAPPVVPPVEPPVTPPVVPPVTPPVNPPVTPPVTPPVEPPVTPPAPPRPPVRPFKKDPWWKKPWLKWLLIILAILLLLWLLSELFNGCSGDEDADETEIVALPPEINPDEDIVTSPDSMTRVVGNRLILVITEGGTVNEFVKEFRTKYPDKSRYQFANPDTLIPRVVLLLPADERESMIERLPAEFPSWNLMVLPETLFDTSDTPNDPAFSDPRKRWYFDMTEVYDAWDETRGDKNVKVAIIDDGFDLTHPEIKGKVVEVYNAVYHNRDIFPQEGGHGMHVAATAAGIADNREGTAGIAPGCDLVLIQVGDRNGIMATSSIIDAVLYAIKSGAKVVNMSLGMEFNPLLQIAPPEMQEEIVRNQFLEEEEMWTKIFEMAEREGVTFVLAAGNQNLIIGLDPMQRSSNTIKVSAVTPDKSKADFSNYGTRSTLSAPGVEIYNALPGGKYDFLQGTSMAAPIVTGGVALLKSMEPTLTTEQAVNILQTTGIPSPSDVGPIVNFGRAAKLLKEKGPDAGEPAPGSTDCESVLQRYLELQQEIEKLRREHPGCIESVDTLEIPEGATVADLRGTWKSTSSLINTDNEEIVLYFTFDGSPKGRLELVEPTGKRFTSSLDVAVASDKVTMHQPECAVSADGEKYYPYDFVLVPDRDRVAQGTAINQAEKFRKIRFNLIRIR